MYNQHLGNDLRMKAKEAARPLHASGRSVAFSIETVCTVLLLFIMLTVVVQFLGGAFVSTQKADGEMNAVVTARQIAEEFQGADSVEEFATAIGGTYDPATQSIRTQVEYVSGVPLDAAVILNTEPRSAGTLYHATINVSSQTAPSATFTLETTHYVSGGDAQ